MRLGGEVAIALAVSVEMRRIFAVKVFGEGRLNSGIRKQVSDILEPYNDEISKLSMVIREYEHRMTGEYTRRSLRGTHSLT